MRKFTGGRSETCGGYLDICRGISSTPSTDAAAPRDRAYPCSPAAACPWHGRAAVAGAKQPGTHGRNFTLVAPAAPSPAYRSNLVGTTRTSRLHFTLSLSRLQSHLRFTIPCYGRARSNPARSAGTSHPSFMATNRRFAGTREATRHAWPELCTCRALRLSPAY